MVKQAGLSLRFFPRLIACGLAVVALGFTPSVVPGVLAGSQETSVEPSPSFELASIKPTSLGEGHNDEDVDFRNGRVKLSYGGTSLIACIESAYDAKDYQISGPSWIKSTRYDINAIGSNPSESRDAWRQMLQNLLADRFQLRLHREAKELPVYELVVTKKGPKLGESHPGDGSSIHGTSGGTSFTGSEMKDLADSLHQATGLPVVDKTGLKGRYEFTLHYSRESQAGVTTPEDGTTALDTAAPSIYTALQEQLGLKLKSAKGQVEVLVIEHIEQPSAN